MKEVRVEKCPECGANMVQILKDGILVWSCPYKCVYYKVGKKYVRKVKWNGKM